MDKRFNSFYRVDQTDPFVNVMISALAESQTRAALPPFITMLRPSAQRDYDEDIGYLRGVCKEMIVHRQKNPSKKRDFLNAMLQRTMTDQSIIDNMITSLEAGKSTRIEIFYSSPFLRNEQVTRQHLYSPLSSTFSSITHMS
jgi:hypothetical protein